MSNTEVSFQLVRYLPILCRIKLIFHFVSHFIMASHIMATNENSSARKDRSQIVLRPPLVYTQRHRCDNPVRTQCYHLRHQLTFQNISISISCYKFLDGHRTRQQSMNVIFQFQCTYSRKKLQEFATTLAYCANYTTQYIASEKSRV